MKQDAQHEPDAVAIRTATAFDLALLAELHAAIFRAPWDQPWSAQSFAEVLAMPGACAWLSIENGAPVGFVLARFIRDEGEILLTGTLPPARRRGHAARMMRAVLDSARAAGVTALFLEHAASNHAAGALYRRFGFSPIGRRRAYYARRGGAGEDAVALRCDLSAAEIHGQNEQPA
ncbi:MAG TPA: GNAT family N-acetyltransferase [Dongiaceae bacterium]|nr:GNAT family N-acetyltransferase [Dongiaceae bacterium]